VQEEKGKMPLFGKPKNTAKKGEITESVILARLVQLGYECLIPWGYDHRYDIAIDDDGKLVRIQCKTARYVEEWGCLEFNTAITYARVGGKPHIRKGYLAACRRERSRDVASYKASAHVIEGTRREERAERDHRQNSVGDDARSRVGSMPSLAG
jgi:hypothetical protein